MRKRKERAREKENYIFVSQLAPQIIFFFEEERGGEKEKDKKVKL